MQQGQLIYLVRPLWPSFSHGFLQETRISQGQINLEYQTHVTPFWPCSGYAAVWNFISNEPNLIYRAFRGLFPRPVLLRTNYLRSGQERALCGDSEEKDRRSLVAGVHTYICCVWLEREEDKSESSIASLPDIMIHNKTEEYENSTVIWSYRSFWRYFHQNRRIKWNFFLFLQFAWFKALKHLDILCISICV